MKHRLCLASALLALVPALARADTWTAHPQPELADQIANARPLEVEEVCQPTQTVRNESPVIVPNPDGRTADVLVAYYKGYQGPATVFCVDTGSGEVRRSDVPRGRNPHIQGTSIAPNGKLYTSLQMVGGGLELWVYDPAANRFAVKTAFGQRLDLMGQTNELVLAPDGKLYGTVGSRAKGEAAFHCIDPDADTVTLLGTAGDLKGSPYCGSMAVTEEGLIYATYGKTPYKLIEFNPASRSGRILATANPRGGIGILRAGGRVSFTIRQPESGAETTGTYVPQDGRLVRTGDVPDRASFKLDKRARTPNARTGASGAANKGARRVRLNKKALGGSISRGARQALVEIDSTRLDPTVNPGKKGVLCYRLRGRAEWTRIELDPPLYAEAIIQLATLPDGRVFGTAANRAGHFIYDPAADETTFLGRTGLQHQSTAISGNSVFLSGYPSSLLWEYDFTKPWQEIILKTKGAKVGANLPNTNPRMLGTLREHSGVHMATCAAVDARGRVYFAGRWYRDGKGGGVGWWDPKTETAGGFWEPLSNLQVIDCKATGEGRYIVLSTLAVPDPVLRREYPETAQLCIIDAAADPSAIAQRISPIPGGKSTGLIAPAGGSRIVGIAPSTKGDHKWLLYGVDVASGQVAFLKPFPGIPQGKLDSFGLLHSYRAELVNAPDSSIWLKHLGVLLCIDPDDAQVTVIGRPMRTAEAMAGFDALAAEDREALQQIGLTKADGAPAGVGRMTFSGRDLYLGGTPTLRRIRNVLNLQGLRPSGQPS